MQRLAFTASFLFCVLLGFAASAPGQGWPLPAKTPETPVTCTSDVCKGKLTPGYSLPITTFVGRFLDSQSNRDYQFTFRTARARSIRIAPERNRIYMVIGSALFAYNTDTFFSRLEANEPLMPSTQGPVGSNTRAGAPEVFLRWDEFFYAEGGSGWITPTVDGQERLYGFDWDDRGNVYLAYSVFGWGIVKDDGGSGGARMPSVYQSEPTTQEITPTRIFVVKTTGGAYYALVTDYQDGITQVWDVTNPASPVRRPNQVGIISLAKNADGTRFAVMRSDRGFVEIHTAETLANGGSPLATFSSHPYMSLATDGTNFFAATNLPSTGVGLSVISPAPSGTWTETHYALGANFNGVLQPIRYGAGYVAVFGSGAYGWDISLYKLNNLVPSEVSLNHYFSKYYSYTPGYATPGYNILLDVGTYKKGNRYYLLVGDFGLGDVYELRGADTVTASVKKLGDTPNPYSTAPPGSGAFYGDKVTFTAATSSSTRIGMTWDFGDGANTTTTSDNPDVAHQYGSLTANDLPASKTARVTSADLTMTDSVTVTLKKPEVRLGIKNTSLLFKQPDASSPAPILTSDEFTDASDGFVEGHFNEWRLDGNTTKTIPSLTLPVGLCGAHTLVYTAHYGPYSGAGSTLASSTTDVPLGINGITYSARPFVVSVGAPTADSLNVTFPSVARASASVADLPLGASTPVTYTWALLNPDLTVKSTTGGPATQTGTATLGTIPGFTRPRSDFNGAQNLKVRLTVTVAASNLGAACQPLLASASLTDSLNGPDPVINVSGCANVGSPCSMTVTSASNASQAGWTYNWSVSGPASIPSSTLASFAPTLAVAGTYTVTLTVNNAIGSSSAQKVVSVAQPVCGSAPTSNNTAIGYSGLSSGCNGVGTVCTAGETITFTAFPYGWTPSSCDTYLWTFGDGAQSSATSPTHIYSSNGSYTVGLTLTGGVSTASLSTTVAVGANPTPPTPTPPTPTPPTPTPPTPTPPNPGGCALLTSQNVYIGYYGSNSACTPSLGACAINEQVTFSPYHPDCGNPSYLWSFGDGGTSTQRNPTHQYTNNGTFTARLTFSNGASSINVSQVVIVGSGGPVPPTPTPPTPTPPTPTPPTPTPPTPSGCPTITSSNAYIGYYGASSACTSVSGDCAQNEEVTFSALSVSVSLTCGNPSFVWNFGDNSVDRPTTQSVTHRFVNGGNYTVTVTINNGNGPVNITQPVRVTGGGGVTPSITVDFSVSALSSVPNGFTFTPTVSLPNVVTKWVWDFGDGDTSTVTSTTPQAKSHVYATAGTYVVTLKVYDSSNNVLAQVQHSAAPPRKRSSHH